MSRRDPTGAPARDVPARDTRMREGRPSRAGGVALALGALFLLELVAGALLARGTFTPGNGVAAACALLALAHAVAFARALEALRRGRSGAGDRASRRTPRLAGIVLFGAAWYVETFLVCASLNPWLGARSLQVATVEARAQTGGPGCRFHVYVFGDRIESGTDLCVDEPAWQRIAVGDHLPVGVVEGRLGQSVDVAPASEASRGAR